VTGFFVAVAVVAMVQFLRVKEARLLLVVALFALRGLSCVMGETTPAGIAADLLSGCAGLTLLLLLSPRPPHPPLH
jgi:hypothetical protein